MYRVSLAVSALVLVACVDEEPVQPRPYKDTCGSTGYLYLVDEQVDSVRFPDDLNYRIVGPDSFITMDNDPDRINFYVDDSGLIQSVRCG